VRLMLAIAEMAAGGAESIVSDLAADAVARGDDVAVVAAPGPLDARLGELGVARQGLPSPRTRARDVGTVLALRRALHAFSPDLVHAHNPRVTVAARAARRLAGARATPLLCTYHAVAPQRARAAARLVRGADRIACVSAPLAAQLVAGGVPDERIVVVRNGTAPAAPVPPQRRAALLEELGSAGGPLISAVGRLVTQKNHARFLEAIALARPDLPEARFLIVGDGPLRAHLERRARELALGERLRFTGVRSDARDVIAVSDLLVLSSDWEGLSQVALEGLAAGVPLLCTPVAGSEELASAGVARVVEAGERALARGLVELLSEPERLREMGARAVELHAAEYSTERMAGDYRRVYANLLRQAGTSPTRS
jgi:glycosyltransferase involved in cell wall biosynthesis